MVEEMIHGGGDVDGVGDSGAWVVMGEDELVMMVKEIVDMVMVGGEEEVKFWVWINIRFSHNYN